MTVVYYDDAADIEFLRDKLIGVIGYGGLGRPIALNLKDSGLKVIVGQRPDESTAILEADAMQYSSIEQVARAATVILMMLPDEVMPEVYLKDVAPSLQRGNTLIFAS